MSTRTSSVSRLRRATIHAMVATLTLGVPGSRAWAGGNESEAGAAPALAVATEPAGAEVYVDGAFQGTTPVSVSGLPAGDHRVRVVKDGYLDNSRLVNVQKGDPQAVRVRLTPGASPTATRLQVDRTEKQGGGKQGGGGKKWIFIGAGVAVAGAGAFLLLRDTNKAPTVSGATASPSIGLAAVTSITLSAQASDPDGDQLTYTWNFGDGGSGNGQSVTHTYQSAGTFNVTVTVTDGKKTAPAASTTVTVKSLNGRWVGAPSGVAGDFFTWNLAQNGTAITGNYSDPVNGSGTAGGSVSSSGSVSLTNSIPGFITGRWSGTLNSDFTRITGTVDWFQGGVRTFTMDKR